jgi:hypothetical protein
MDLKQVMKNFNLLNGILLICSLIFAHNFLFPRLNSKVTFISPSIKENVVEKNNEETPKTQSLSPQDYSIIVDHNLFHPERKIPSEKKMDVVLSRPEFVLFGTLITSDMSIAYMEDKKVPVSSPGRGLRQTALKKGESLSGFLLKEVMENKVVMVRGNESIWVSLGDQNSHKRRENPTEPNSQSQLSSTSGISAPLSKEVTAAAVSRPDLSHSVGTQPAWTQNVGTQTVGTQPAVSNPSIGDATSTQTPYTRWKPFPSRRQYPIQ